MDANRIWPETATNAKPCPCGARGDFALAQRGIGEEDRSMMKILVPVDFSDRSGRLLAVAGDEAKARGGELVLLHVIEPAAEVAGFETDPEMMRLKIGQDLDQEKRVESARLKELAAGLVARGVACTSVVKFGLPADEIISAVQDQAAGLIVMGSHGHGALFHLFTGSVVTGVLKLVECPVLVVPLRQRST
jgi:nucleotide-binding universal stress UspA family protein